jgi:cellulose synthase/poly-beta-1,6-N-acetylglucosamine synthase-like glycosyltransferase
MMHCIHLLLTSRTFTAVACLLSALWLWRMIPALFLLSRIPDLHDARFDAASRQMAAPTLTVIVPACNEAASIAAALRALLACEYASLQIIAVNDRSTDATGAEMEAVASEPAAQGRLRVLHIDTLPEGWLGKPHAMMRAAQLASSEWLLFTDADIFFAPDVLRRALACAVQSHADHMVVYPTLILRRWDERGFLTFFQSFSVWAGRPWQIANSRAKRDFIGVGAFNLIRRDVYEKLGGFAAMPLEVLEDMRLGYSVKQAGFAQRAAFGRDMVRVRWAEGALGVVHNLSKNMFAAFRYCVPLLLAACAGILLLCLTPVAALLVPGPARWAATTVFTVMALLHLRYWPQTRLSPLHLYFFPMGALLFAYTMLRSMTLILWRGGVLWRGTLYPLAVLRRAASAPSAK